MAERPRCYIASPFGFDEAGRYYYREVFIPALEAVVEPVDPWSSTMPAEIETAAAGQQRETAVGIGQRNAAAIRASDLLVAVLEGQEPDSGTVVELGYAAALGKRCFGLRSDLRQAGEEGVALNLQVESFIVTSGGIVARTLAGLLAALRQDASTAA
jgi:nucleoside 2-deoxyribosyltransferase